MQPQLCGADWSNKITRHAELVSASKLGRFMKVINEKTPFKPEDVDYDGTRLETLNAHFERLMNEKKLLGAAYMLSRNSKIFAHASMGPKSALENEKEPMEPDVIFYTKSITKLFTAVAIFKLAEDGFLRPNQPAKDFLPEMNIRPFHEITIAHLLSHTSGLFPDRGCFDFEYNSPWDWNFVRENTREGETWVRGALRSGMHCKPGTQWNYCTFGFVLLGEIIARITGMRAETWIRKNICEPCGMTDSFFENEFYYNELPSEYAQKMLDRHFIQWPDNYDEEKQYFTAYAKGERPDLSTMAPHYWYKVSKPTTGNGLASTVKDLNKFGRMLLNNGITDDGVRIIGRKAIERMTECYTTPDIGEYTWGANGLHRDYALGPDIRRTADNQYSKGSFFHEGYGSCCLVIDPTEKMVASWYVPYPNGNWIADGLYNASTVMWSGLK